jgi:hypothetical protein
MTKNIYEENKELKRTLYIIEKVLLDFRLTQLDLPETESLGMQKVELKPLGVTPCTCGDSCNCDEEKEILKEQITRLKNELNSYKNKEVNEVPEVEAVDYREQMENEVSSFIPVEVDEEPKKERKSRKERGGTVFTDFKTLSLDNNDFEGNSIVYSKKDM